MADLIHGHICHRVGQYMYSKWSPNNLSYSVTIMFVSTLLKGSKLIMSNLLTSPVLTTKAKGRSYRIGNIILSYGTASMKGWRKKMENVHNTIPFLDKQTSLFAVYDGHGGPEVSLYCQNNLPSRLKECSDFKSGDVVCALHEVFQGLDAEVRTTPANQEMTALLDSKDTLNKIAFQSGTTATVCVLNNSSITVANVGDSRCVLSRLGRAYPLSYDHKPTDDREHFRIVQAVEW